MKRKMISESKGMPELVVPMEKFDFDKFMNASMRYNAKVGCPEIHPSFYISKVKARGAYPEEVPETGWDGFTEWLKQGGALFVPFAGPNTGDPMLCADGKTRSLDYDEDDFSMGDSDLAGLFVELEKGKYKLNAAVFSLQGVVCSLPGDVSLHDCGKFNAPMRAWAEKFVRK